MTNYLPTKSTLNCLNTQIDAFIWYPKQRSLRRIGTKPRYSLDGLYRGLVRMRRRLKQREPKQTAQYTLFPHDGIHLLGWQNLVFA